MTNYLQFLLSPSPTQATPSPLSHHMTHTAVAPAIQLDATHKYLTLPTTILAYLPILGNGILQLLG